MKPLFGLYVILEPLEFAGRRNNTPKLGKNWARPHTDETIHTPRTAIVDLGTTLKTPLAQDTFTRTPVYEIHTIR